MGKARILLVGEGSQKLGMGHLVRLVSIHDAFSLSYDTYFLINENLLGVKFAKSKGLKYDVYDDYSGMLQIIKAGGKYEAIVVDILKVPVNVLTKIRHYCNCLIVFDDLGRLANRDLEALIVCPQETFRSSFERKKRGILVKGADYFSLMDNFLFHRRLKTFQDSVSNILISLGGAPSIKHSLLVARFLDATLDKKISIHVVLGYATNKLKSKFSKRIIFYNQLPDLVALIKKVDLGIISAGFIKFEFMCIGTPFCMVSLNSHQASLAKKFSSKGFGIYLGDINSMRTNAKVFSKKIQKFVADCSLRKNIFVRSRKLVDGKGSIRLLKLFKALKKERETV